MDQPKDKLDLCDPFIDKRAYQPSQRHIPPNAPREFDSSHLTPRPQSIKKEVGDADERDPCKTPTRPSQKGKNFSLSPDILARREIRVEAEDDEAERKARMDELLRREAEEFLRDTGAVCERGDGSDGGDLSRTEREGEDEGEKTDGSGDYVEARGAEQ